MEGVRYSGVRTHSVQRIRRMIRAKRGYAMLLMMVAMLVLSSISFVVVSSSARDQESSRLTSAKSEARIHANSALEDFFARISTDPTFAQDVTLASQGEPVRRTKYQTLYPALVFDSLPSTATDPGNSWQGARLVKMGLETSDQTLQPLGSLACPNDDTKYDVDCFVVRVESSAVSGILTVTASSRVRCAGNHLRCVTVSLSQRLRKVQYYDYLVAQEYTTVGLSEGLLPANSPSFPQGLDEITGETNMSPELYEASCANKKASVRPSMCLSISYLGSSAAPDISDSINGPLYTADDYVYVCGNPTGDSGQSAFTSVTLSGPGNAAAWYKQECPGITPATPTYVTLNHPTLKLPSNSRASADSLLGLAVVPLVSPAIMVFVDSGVHISQAGGAFDFRPYDGKVFEVANGASAVKDVTLKGLVNGKVSIISRGDAAIVGNLSYACAVYDTCDDFLSLTTDGSLEVWQECNTSETSACIPQSETCPPEPSLVPCISLPANASASDRVYERKVDGILVSLNSYIGTPDWYSNINDMCPLPPEPVTYPPPAASCRPSLMFTGSMTSKYQGVFGAYDFGNGQLIGGFYKKFTHDPRLKVQSNDYTRLPPYTISSLVAVWSRLDLLEISTK